MVTEQEPASNKSLDRSRRFALGLLRPVLFGGPVNSVVRRRNQAVGIYRRVKRTKCHLGVLL
jgi:hypothetical protein